MDSKNGDQVSWQAFEAERARAEVALWRLGLILGVIIVLLIAAIVWTNLAWLNAWKEYDFESYEVSADGDGSNANYIGRDGDINNGGTSKSTETDEIGEQGQGNPEKA